MLSDDYEHEAVRIPNFENTIGKSAKTAIRPNFVILQNFPTMHYKVMQLGEHLKSIPYTCTNSNRPLRCIRINTVHRHTLIMW